MTINIKKQKINSVKKYFANIAEDQEIYVRVLANEENLGRLKLNGCSNGTSVVPVPVGPITKFNLYGKEIIHKEREKEIREIQRDYHIVDWHGTDHYGTCFQSRMCYPKEYIFPPMVKVILDNKELRSELMTKVDSEMLKHTVNMFLEVFGYCEIIDGNQSLVEQNIKIKEVSWQILPKGQYPWESVDNILSDYFEKAPNKNKTVLRNNHKIFAEYGPDFIAIGENGFYGYVVYGYSNMNLYVFESNQTENATYVFRGEWENASRLTKHDIIKGNLCYKRIVHSKSWKENVKEIFECK